MTAPADEANSTVTRPDLVEDLRGLGLESGAEVVVHSSLSSIGWVDGGADTVVDALLEVVGATESRETDGTGGTVAVPTFTSGVVREEPFDRGETNSRTGAVTEALRTRPDAVRSAHPTHSVAALGPAAEMLTADHALDRSLGRDSPLHRLAQRGGYILLIGIGHERNSSIHVAESLADVPYKTGTKEVLVRTADGVESVDVARVGCAKGFPAVEPVAEREGVLIHGRLGQARAQLLRGADILEIATEMLVEDPGVLLCDAPDCWWCPEARERLDDAGAVR